MEKADIFLRKNAEKENLNQYWYRDSKGTINALVEEVQAIGGATAFLSTPSIYFSLTDPNTRASSRVFDMDPAFGKDPGFVKYDFNAPEAIPAELHGTFDLVVIDPPFITREVWDKYATAAKLLLRPAASHSHDAGGAVSAPGDPAAQPPGELLATAQCGRVLCSTIAENRAMMEELFGAVPVRFQPSIPHLVYQYDLYANFHTHRLAAPNPEIP